jgi:hypothetical protein
VEAREFLAESSQFIDMMIIHFILLLLLLFILLLPLLLQKRKGMIAARDLGYFP